MDAKRKLRLVLSWASNIPKTFGQTEGANNTNSNQVGLNNNKTRRPLISTNSNEVSTLNNNKQM